MRDNRPFSEKEDEIIRDMYENQNIKKWSMIARALSQEHNFPRNAKQCRDRYHRHLDPLMVSEWTREQQQKLYQLHNQIGNKWAVIAQKFPGRTDNSVKNHFYSKLRKSLRHLNKVIKQRFRKQFKQLKIGAIYKIIEALEDRFNERTAIDQQVFNKCIILKRQLLEYSNQQNYYESQNFEKEKQLIKEINQFSRSYKRKTKRQRKSSLNGADLFKPSSLQKRVKYSSDQESSQSQFSQKYQSENESQQSQVDLGVIQEDIRQSLVSKFSAAQNQPQKSNEVNKNQLRTSEKSFDMIQVQEALKGVIEQGQIFMCKPEISFCSVSIRSESERHDMFDDNLRISEKLRQVQEMEQQEPQNSIFRSHR